MLLRDALADRRDPQRRPDRRARPAHAGQAPHPGRRADAAPLRRGGRHAPAGGGGGPAARPPRGHVSAGGRGRGQRLRLRPAHARVRGPGGRCCSAQPGGAGVDARDPAAGAGVGAVAVKPNAGEVERLLGRTAARRRAGRRRRGRGRGVARAHRRGAGRRHPRRRGRRARRAWPAALPAVGPPDRLVAGRRGGGFVHRRPRAGPGRREPTPSSRARWRPRRPAWCADGRPPSPARPTSCGPRCCTPAPTAGPCSTSTGWARWCGRIASAVVG